MWGFRLRESEALTTVPNSGTLAVMDWMVIKRLIGKTPEKDLAEVARRSKVPHGTLWNIKHGKTRNPRVETYIKLARYFGKRAA